MRSSLIFLFILISPFSNLLSQNEGSVREIDSIHNLVQRVNNSKLDLRHRIISNHKLYLYAKQFHDDSLMGFALKKFVNLHYKSKDSLNFQKYAQQRLEFSQRRFDTASVAKVLEYKSAFYKRHHAVDSTFYYYYKSFKLYEAIGDSLSAGKIMLNTAILQKNVHDYSGAEISSFRALDFLKNTKNTRRISSVYNNLGIIYNNLKNYDKAIEYHEKAYRLRIEIKDKPIYAIQSLNNIGKSYKDAQNYQKAIRYFNLGLSENDSILSSYPETKAALIDNMAHAHFRTNRLDSVLTNLEQALNIRERESDDHGIIMSYIHLAEYYKDISIDTSVAYIERAERIAHKTKKYRDYLVSLEFMAELYPDNRIKDKFKEYIAVRDSLDLVDRRYKEDFIRIKYELNEKDDIISEQRVNNRKRLYVILALSVFALVLLFAYLLFMNKKRRRESELIHIIDTLKESQKEVFSIREPSLGQNYRERFNAKLKQKYNLTDSLIEFWTMQSQGFSEAEIAEKLKSVTEGAIKKRRNKLYKKLKAYDNSLDRIDKLVSVSIYQKEFLTFQKTLSKE